jgi:hypothetical protein
MQVPPFHCYYLLRPKYLLSPLFSHILSLYPSLGVVDSVSQPHKIRGKIIVVYILEF